MLICPGDIEAYAVMPIGLALIVCDLYLDGYVAESSYGVGHLLQKDLWSNDITTYDQKVRQTGNLYLRDSTSFKI